MKVLEMRMQKREKREGLPSISHVKVALKVNVSE
jgi:hypothetical protein